MNVTTLGVRTASQKKPRESLVAGPVEVVIAGPTLPSCSFNEVLFLFGVPKYVRVNEEKLFLLKVAFCSTS